MVSSFLPSFSSLSLLRDPREFSLTFYAHMRGAVVFLTPGTHLNREVFGLNAEQGCLELGLRH